MPSTFRYCGRRKRLLPWDIEDSVPGRIPTRSRIFEFCNALFFFTLTWTVVIHIERAFTCHAWVTEHPISSSQCVVVQPRQFQHRSSSIQDVSLLSVERSAMGRRKVGWPSVIVGKLGSTSLRQMDFDVEFGSQNSSGVSWGEEDDDDNDDQGERKQYDAKVAELLQQSDDEFKRQWKIRKWGNFANATSKEEIQDLLEQGRQTVEEENQLKKQLAAVSGIQLTVLEPQLLTDNNSGAVSISKNNDRASWFAEMDDELKEEWKSLTKDDKDMTALGADAAEHNYPITKRYVTSISDSQDIFLGSQGTIVTRDSLAGVRVGSAGGWTLEVFPRDFVVHRKYGIGRYERTTLRPRTKLTADEKKARDERRGDILTRELRKRKAVTATDIKKIRAKFGTDDDKDPISNPQTTVLEISYADAVVHVPVDRAYRLSRFRAGDSLVKPRLSRIKGEAWAKAKQRVEESTVLLAQDVLALYATRETLQRRPFDPSLESQVKEFESTFLYEPTSDQQKCFEDVENDMVWRQRPMDRLVCGDVGFGKTEVAIRAIYRAIVNGKQAALLAPTGVLAAQHFKTFVKRMSPFGVQVMLLRGSVGKNSKMGKASRENIADGTAQVVIGTHALLSDNVKFKDLGLLVVDEEQRFGVKQKERLKLICNGVDVLTLSATPIPRTLQMSLSGVRDTSTIRSPPPMRKPTISYVQEYSTSLVEFAIRQERERGGQCFYVVPRISMLRPAEEKIRAIFPDIRIIQAHGRMQRNGAEDNVADFAEGNYDVLLATTVIENGVDIPSVNTIIIEGAECFGMSTLYQLRGRVGRSSQQAYAFFLHWRESTTGQAALRLQAIGELNELGSGFDVANRDLEIRGAGSLLGTEQSGLAAKVGFDLYMRMLKKSIRKMRGLDLPLVPRTNILLPTNGTPDTFSIPADFIPDPVERQKEVCNARLAESTAVLVQLTNAWKDRYGPLPPELQSQLKTIHLHACTRRLGVDLLGLVDNDDEGRVNCIMRSPGLRPRHWTLIAPQIPTGVIPKGVSLVFPSRFTHKSSCSSEGDTIVRCSSRNDLEALQKEESQNEEREDEEWDSMDEEELEAMKDISSAVSVKTMDDIDLTLYPRIIVHDFGTASAKSTDKLLKILLPIARVVTQLQQKQADDAKVAVDLRQRQDLLRSRKKQNNVLEAKRKGYLVYGDVT